MLGLQHIVTDCDFLELSIIYISNANNFSWSDKCAIDARKCKFVKKKSRFDLRWRRKNILELHLWPSWCYGKRKRCSSTLAPKLIRSKAKEATETLMLVTARLYIYFIHFPQKRLKEDFKSETTQLSSKTGNSSYQRGIIMHFHSWPIHS